MLWGDLISLEYGKPVKDKARTDGAVPVYGTNGIRKYVLGIDITHIASLTLNSIAVRGTGRIRS